MIRKSSAIKFLLSGALLTTAIACGDDAPPQTGTASQVNDSPSGSAVGQRNATGGLAWARKRYERVIQMDRSGLLRCDTVGYQCGAVSGTFTFCRSDGELLRAGHRRQTGDHQYLNEWYYYDGEEMYLADLKKGSWRFADADDGVKSASATPTIDEVHEERRYYERGNLLDRDFKDYTLRSWADTLRPEDLPVAGEGTGVDGGTGSEVVLSVAQSGSYECR